MLWCHKRRRDDRASTGGNRNDGSGDDPNKHPALGPTPLSSVTGPRLRLACPYFKYDPARYSAQKTCRGPGGWPDAHRLKYDQLLLKFMMHVSADSEIDNICTKDISLEFVGDVAKSYRAIKTFPRTSQLIKPVLSSVKEIMQMVLMRTRKPYSSLAPRKGISRTNLSTGKTSIEYCSLMLKPLVYRLPVRTKPRLKGQKSRCLTLP